MMALPLLSSPPPVVGHESALFNPLVVMGGDAQATAEAACTTSNDRQVRVSVRLHPPPAESYVHMQTDDRLLKDPLVLAAFGDLLLLHIVVLDAAAAAAGAWAKDTENLFVYKAHPVCPWLRRLPNTACSTGWAQAAAIVSTDEGGFVVASFRTFETLDFDPATSFGQEMAKLLRYPSATGQWDFRTPTMPYDGVALKPFLWKTDKVFASSDGTIYWVDYHRGLLSCNVLAAGDNPELRFTRLPEIEIWTEPNDFSDGRLYPEAYRTVSACKGIVKFVDVDNGFFGSMKKSGFTVTVWTLKLPEYEWDKVSVLQMDDLWSLPNFRDASLPRWVPQFPMVSTQDSHVLHFILQQYNYVHEVWIITVDMHDKVLKFYQRRVDSTSGNLE